MLVELVFDLAKLGLFVGCGFFAINAYARYRRPLWVKDLSRRHLALLGLLTLAMSAVKVTEDVLARESGPVDTAILWFIRDHVPSALAGSFQLLSLSGSAAFLVSVTVLLALALLLAGRRFEALLVGTSTLGASLVIYLLKTLVGRARPELWDAQWYWGSSFPSGHVLGTAAFSAAAALCLARIWPRSSTPAMALAILWTVLVAASRLVLGVHWPSDVLAAMCLGGFIPLALSVAHDLRPGSQGAGPSAA